MTDANRSDNEGPIGRLDQVGIDVGDLDRATAFWSAVLGLTVADRDDQYVHFERLPGSLAVYLQKVPEEKTSKTRVHVDVAVKDLETALGRVGALGGTEFQRVEESGSRWIVVADPDGNEFCLVQG